MHAVLVEVVEEVCLFIRVARRHHVLGVEQHPDDVEHLNGVAHFRIGVVVHLFDDHVQEEILLKTKMRSEDRTCSKLGRLIGSIIW